MSHIPPHIEVASDSEAMRMALQEYIVRLMFEHGSKWESHYYRLVGAAKEAALDEVLKSKVIKESAAPF